MRLLARLLEPKVVAHARCDLPVASMTPLRPVSRPSRSRRSARSTSRTGTCRVPKRLLALFDRAAARDFADVYVLARRFGKDVLLARAAQIDTGFDVTVLAGMMATFDRFTDSEIPVPEGREQESPLRQPGRAVDITARIERGQVLGGLISEYHRAA
jgi:hypothetical protein